MRRTAFLALLALAACKRSPPKGALAVGQVAVSEAGLAGKPEVGESAEQLRKELQSLLEATGRFTMRADGPVTIDMEIDRAQRVFAPVPMVEQGQASPPEREMAEVALHIEMTSSGAQGDVDRLLAEGEARRPTNADDTLDPAARHAAFDAALDAAMHEAVVALKDQIDARHKTDDQLLADLSSQDSRVRDYAIRVLADRRSPAAVPQLIARLSDQNPDVARRAAGALIAIGDRRAVSPLIEMTRKRRPEDVGPILYAIASLGGPEAEAYLFTLESGSPDEEIRRAAQGAYADLVRRKQEQAAAGDTGRRTP
ncbi:MAG: HEAT repeat domain-containing protein [Myxococcales bacterium]